MITGTIGNDTLNDTEADDTIDGLAGDDVINSTLGGYDTIRGGDGQDRIFLSRPFYEKFGPITVDGGAGDDFIRIGELRDYQAVVFGGDGNDRIELDRSRGAASIDAGAGNDLILINAGRGQLWLLGVATGDGADIVRFAARGATGFSLSATITDFTPGAGGDRIDFGDYLYLLPGWDQSTNPFAGNYLFINQSGQDTILWFDRDGSAGSSTDFREQIVFENAQATAFTAYNFFGYAPDGSPPAALVINGTANDDKLTGEAGADVIHGLAGNDTIDGNNGPDAIYGDDGNDTLTDYSGATAGLYGGAGNDILTVFRYDPTVLQSGVVDGGEGDDLITVSAGNASLSVLGGAGADTFRILAGAPAVDAGSGDDIFIVTSSFQSVTLGAGADTVRYESAFGFVSIADFEAGPGGDRIDLVSILLLGARNWDNNTNPFATGHLRLVQSGTSVAIYFHNGSVGNYSPERQIAELHNVTAPLTADNLGGFDPNGAQPAGLVIAGTAGPDTLTGWVGSDTIQGLAGNDVIRGYVGNDQIDGGDGDDLLDGEGGSDVVDGGLGNDVLVDAGVGDDTLRGGAGNDLITLTRTRAQIFYSFPPSTVVLDGGDGDDTIRVVALDTQQGEHIFATIDGGAGNDLVTITGLEGGTVNLGAGDDRIELFAVSQVLDATIHLGLGSDTVVLRQSGLGSNGSFLGNRLVTDFKVGDGGDRVTFLEDFGGNPWMSSGPLHLFQQGANTLVRFGINSYGQYVLLTLQNVLASDLSPYNLGGFDSGIYDPVAHNITGTPGPDDLGGADLADTISGGGGDDLIFGAGGNDTLNGNGGADLLQGSSGNDMLDGGAGVDRMEGGTGDDTYFVDVPGDVAAEAAGQGRDVVYSSVDYTLAAGQEIEVLSASNHAGTDPLALTGNALGQEIWGNAGANNLRGGGGNDFLLGLGGDDTYFVDTASALVFESAGNGRDVVYASVSYALLAGQSLEVLSTSSHAAMTAIDLTGNEFGQEIWGNAGANSLRGGGGNDFLIGQGGNDTYFVDVAAVQIYEAAGGGRDVVYASVNYALLGGQEVEVLSTANHAATTALNMTGNELAQEIWGNAGANMLDGKLGNDVLIGQGGADTFAFTSALANNVDFIADFVAGTDKIALDDAVFTGLAPGALPASAFVVGTAALDANDRIIYNSATGQLYFDADGNGMGAAVQFAALNGAPGLAAGDFTVI